LHAVEIVWPRKIRVPLLPVAFSVARSSSCGDVDSR